jgi:hypothetical protein
MTAFSTPQFVLIQILRMSFRAKEVIFSSFFPVKVVQLDAVVTLADNALTPCSHHPSSAIGESGKDG